LPETLSNDRCPIGVAKKKDKDKDKDKTKKNDRPKRKDLTQELEDLQLQNDALRARLDRIAEIATAEPELGEPNDIKPAV
jgi:hypothetical protein